MPQANIFRWPAGRGWLVLSGGGAWDSEDVESVEASILNHTHSQGPIAYIWAAGDVESADRHMDALRELGARTGFLVDILTEEEETLSRQLSEAGVIILGDGPRGDVLRDALAGLVLRGIEEAYGRGATVYAIGTAAMLMGAHVVQDHGLVPGFNWLAQAIIVPGYTPDRADQLHDWVQQHPADYGLGLGEGSALALGSRGEVEIWGRPAVTVSLGSGFDAGSASEGE